MARLKISKAQEKRLYRQAQNRLHTALQTAIIPWLQEELREDTGRLSKSVYADYPLRDGGDVTTTVTIGGTTETGDRPSRYIGGEQDPNQPIEVDYVEALYGRGGAADGELQEVIERLPGEMYYLGL